MAANEPLKIEIDTSSAEESMRRALIVAQQLEVSLLNVKTLLAELANPAPSPLLEEVQAIRRDLAFIKQIAVPQIAQLSL